MVKDLKCPHVFVTASAADIQWTDLHRHMPQTVAEDATEQEIKRQFPIQRCLSIVCPALFVNCLFPASGELAGHIFGGEMIDYDDEEERRVLEPCPRGAVGESGRLLRRGQWETEDSR